MKPRRSCAAFPSATPTVLWDLYGTGLAGALHIAGRHDEELHETTRRLRHVAGSVRALEERGCALAVEQANSRTVRLLVPAALIRLGERDAADSLARAALASLTTPYLRGANTLARAEIAAVLGERADATRLLRQAIAEGQTPLVVHATPELVSLRGNAPYEALVKPAG